MSVQSVSITSEPENAVPEKSGPGRGQGPSALKLIGRVASTLWRQKRSRAGLLLLGIFILAALLAPVISPYSPTENTFPAMLGSTSGHLLGTTGSGQDVLSQLIYGTRNSLVVALVTASLVTVIGVAVGMLAGYLAGVVDVVLNFIMNVLLVIPALPLMIVIATYEKSGGTLVIILVITLVSWAIAGRVVRSRVIGLRNLDFITAARFSGDGPLRIITRELFPNMISLVAALFFGTAIGAVLAAAGLEFIGLGSLQSISWGNMLYWAQSYNLLTQGLLLSVLAPGVCIAVLASSFALINFGIDELSNPRLRED